ISLGHINNGIIDVGVLACPRLSLPHLSDGEEVQQGRLFFAERGRGAWSQIYNISADPVPIHVSECKDPSKATLFRSYESKHTDVEKTNRFCEKMGMKMSIPVDSQVKYGLLACGEGEIILRFTPPDNPNYREKVWDHIGGAIILQEAGGKVTDIFGKPFQYNGESLLTNSVGVFASNGYLHDIGVKILQEIMGEL
ncbi:MAG: inositol monophosphatase family protein, partial [Candidatus Hydrogenedens sp.]